MSVMIKLCRRYVNNTAPWVSLQDHCHLPYDIQILGTRLVTHYWFKVVQHINLLVTLI